jgi:hypothetical protein
MQKARQPGKRRISGATMKPCWSPIFMKARYMSPIPSTGRARIKSVINMIGARKNMDEKGLDVAGCRIRRICVRDQRRPDDAAAVITRKNPLSLNSVSPSTMRNTPTDIVAITAPSFHEGFSKRNRNAKIRTKPKTEDLHIARDYISN